MGIEAVIQSALKPAYELTKNFVKENRQLCLGSALLVSACFLDAYYTSIFLRQYGVGCEMNPAARYFITKFGVEIAPYLYKTFLAVPLIYLSGRAKETWPLYAGANVSLFGALSWHIF